MNRLISKGMSWEKQSFIKRHRRVVHRVTTNGNEWYSEWQRVTTSSTTSDNEWYNEWQRLTMATNDNEWHKEYKQMKANESDFRFENKTIMQCITTIYSATSFWNCNVKQKIYRSSQRRFSIKKNTYFEEHLWRATSASVLNKNKRCLRDSKNLSKLGLINWWIYQIIFK